MKLNCSTKITGENIVLVPYKEHHVPKYHEWMKSEILQKLTASEPLSLEDEYQMQRSWREDENKCTFIILDKKRYQAHLDEVGSMIGDTNIFIDRETDTGEIEIMIAEETARGKRLGWEAVIMMLIYGIKFINLKSYEVKISFTNSISIRMFEKLTFVERSRSEVFQEVTLYRDVDDEWVNWLLGQFNYEIQEHY